jgi:hypothetical protein
MVLPSTPEFEHDGVLSEKTKKLNRLSVSVELAIETTACKRFWRFYIKGTSIFRSLEIR